MAERGSPFDPPAFCGICHEELYHAEPHICGTPIEGTAAWFEPALEGIYMEKRREWLKPKNIGDVTHPHEPIALGPVPKGELPSAEE